MKNRGVFNILMLLSIFIISSLDSFSQLVISTFDKIDCTNYPICSVDIKAERNGTKINIKPENLVIVENNNSSRPKEVLENNDGTQKIKWYCTLGALYEGAWFYVTDAEETAVTGEYYDNLSNYMSQVRMYPVKKEYTKEFFFNSPAGTEQYTRTTIELKAIMAPQVIIDGMSVSRKIKIDSIKTYTSDFMPIWDPRYVLPCEIIDGFTYKIIIRFYGRETNKLYRDKLTVFYEGGITEEVDLIANTYKIVSKTMLTLLEPKPGEHLTPCQKDTIKWKGHVPGVETVTEYSINGGITWNNIGKSKDSFFVWTVPDVISDNFYVRVKQSPQGIKDIALNFEDIPFEQSRFSDNAIFILGANKAGKIYEWDLSKSPPEKSPAYSIGDYYSLPIDNIKNLFVGYTDDHKSFVTAFRYMNLPFSIRQDTLAFFNVGDPNPTLKVGLSKGIVISKMLIDYKKRWISILPESSNLIKLYSPTDGSLIKNLVFNTPINDFSFVNGTDSLVIAFNDNTVGIYDLNTNLITASFNFKDHKLISNVALAGNGKYISFTTIMPNKPINEYSYADPISGSYIYEISSAMFVRSYRGNASNTIGLDFNPTSNKVVRASVLPDHIAILDLSYPTDNETGNIPANSGILDNYSFAPEGHRLSAISLKDNVFIVRTFSYSEIDEVDAPIAVEYPIMTVQDVTIEPKYIGTTNPYTYNANFCNNGNVPFLMKDANFIRNKNFKLKNVTLPDTILPGDCFTFNIEYNPVDTGTVIDSLEFSTCAQNFYIKFESKGLARNISFASASFDFGQVCLSKFVSKNILLLTNSDPVPLRINTIEFFDKNDTPFKTTNPFKDTVIQAGQTLSIDITFAPTVLRENTKTLKVFHSNQKYMTADTKVTGLGIGSDLSFSHPDLRFIPEIRSRSLTIYNNQVNDVEISSYSFSPEGLYSLNAPLPIMIKGNDSLLVELQFTGDAPDNCVLEFKTSPCFNSYRIYLGPYTGVSNLTINDTQADPRGNATIKVAYSNINPKEYNGVRYFEAEITINPRMFIPYGDTPVSSNYGTATLLRNEIVNDKRIIGFRVDGDFPSTGVVANINGLAGLAETSTSAVEFVTDSKFWSKNVDNILTNGTFKIINVCGDRYVNQKNNSILIQGLTPNPVKDKFVLNVESKIKTDCIIEIYDINGSLLSNTSNISIIQGNNEIVIDTIYLNTGNYKIVVKTANDIVSATFVVIK